MEESWSKALVAVGAKVNPQVYNMRIKPLRLGGVGADGRQVVLAKDDFSAEYVRRNFGAQLEESLSREVGEAVRLVFQADPDAVSIPLPLPGPPEPSPETAGPNKTGLLPQYTFDSFVVGSSNQFAYAAAARVADEPALAYNPLFIHGGTGLGKTHLMHAIGNELRTNRPKARVLYATSEHFITQFIDCLRFKRVQDFKQNFRSVDVLLVDDIQFIAGKNKKATQEEFFHTFNALFEADKQIILSSDSFPSAIEHLEERLRSRFAWGLVADIHPPDLETRVAILKKKAHAEGMDIEDDVAFFLAEAIESNVRELEGALIRVFAMASMAQGPVTLSLVRDSLRHSRHNPDSRPRITIESIQETVAAYHHILLSDLNSANRSRRFSFPRQIAMYLCKKLTNHSYPEIGHRFGKRDHTTVMHAVRKIEKLKQKDSELAEDLHSLSGIVRK